MADPPEGAEPGPDPAAAGELLRERQANANDQHAGRPSVWMGVPSGAAAQRSSAPRTGASLPPIQVEDLLRPN